MNRAQSISSLMGIPTNVHNSFRPDWTEWNLKPTLTLFEAVALSLDLDPKKCLTDNQKLIGIVGTSRINLDRSKNFQIRLDLLTRSFFDQAITGTNGEPVYFPRDSILKKCIDFNFTLPTELSTEHLTPPYQSTTRHELKKIEQLETIIGMLTNMLAKRNMRQYLHGKSVNVSAIVKDIETILDNNENLALRGMKNTSIRTMIGDALKAVKGIKT